MTDARLYIPEFDGAVATGASQEVRVGIPTEAIDNIGVGRYEDWCLLGEG